MLTKAPLVRKALITKQVSRLHSVLPLNNASTSTTLVVEETRIDFERWIAAWLPAQSRTGSGGTRRNPPATTWTSTNWKLRIPQIVVNQRMKGDVWRRKTFGISTQSLQSVNCFHLTGAMETETDFKLSLFAKKSALKRKPTIYQNSPTTIEKLVQWNEN